MKKKDIKLLSEAIEKNFFDTYNKIKRLDEVTLKKKLIIESVEDVMMNLKNHELLGGYVLNIIPQHEMLTIEISSEPDQHSGKRTDDFDKFQIHYFYNDKDWDLSGANTQPSPEDEGLLEKIGGLVSAEKQKEAEYIAKQKEGQGGMGENVTEDEGSQGGNSMERLKQALIKLSPDFGEAIYTDGTGFIGHPWGGEKMKYTSNNGAIAVVDEKGHYHCFPCKGYIRGHHNQISNSEAFSMVQQAVGEAGFGNGSIGVKCGSGNRHSMD